MIAMKSPLSAALLDGLPPAGAVDVRVSLLDRRPLNTPSARNNQGHMPMHRFIIVRIIPGTYTKAQDWKRDG